MLLLAVLACGAGLAAWKYLSIQSSHAASAHQPEPMESVTVVEAQEIRHRPTTTSIGTVLALRSITLHNEVPGITIPEPVQKRLADAGSDARLVGFELGRSLVEGARERAAGVYVIPPFKEPTAALELLQP